MSGNLKNPENELIDQKISAKKHLGAKSDYHDDFDQIKTAVLETQRGRWFLGEFARQSRQIESQLVLGAIAALERKLTHRTVPKPLKANVKPAKPVIKKVEIPKTVPKPIENFETKRQSSHFGRLFANFKQKTLFGLRWAGIKDVIEFSKIQTIINFAAYQSRASIQTQEKKLNTIIADLRKQNIDPTMIRRLNVVASELHKLEELQGNLNIQLEDGLKFMGEVEKIAQHIEPDFEKFTPKAIVSNIKAVVNDTKAIVNNTKTIKKPQETVKIKPKITKLGPAGRIKKMFKIEQTLHDQQAENLIVPGKAFDEAFASEQLKVEQEIRSISNAENIEKDLQPIEVKSTLSRHTQKLSQISDKMKEADHKLANIEQEPEIIIEEDFNALNSLALLSKTERTMLFTLQN
ncbi:MAG: hypothetical protein COC24_011670 [Alphaproteobacteria bacterium]|nr:hypothetical protein [Alphaproteobacteria bacterium]